MTWVLVIVVCTTLPAGCTCESEVVAHQLHQSECVVMAKQLADEGKSAECLVEDDDTTEEPDET